MLILSYNINHFSQEKLDKVLQMEADVYILPELANQSLVRLPADYNMEWMGDLDFKGLGVIWKSGIKAEIPQWFNPSHEYFLPKNVVKDVVKDVVKGIPQDILKELSERQLVILEIIASDSTISAKAISEKMSEKESVDERTIQRDLAKIKKLGILRRKGGRKNGEWDIIYRV